MLASDLANPQFVGASNPDQALYVTFYVKPVQSPFKTQQEGRPIFEDVTYIRINTPGNQLNVIERPMYDSDPVRFPLQWAQYQQAHGDAKVSGTPLSAWPLLTQSQAEELKALKFYTVEMIANASDQQVTGMGMLAGMDPYQFRARAKAFLNAANNTAEPQKLAGEIEQMKREREQERAELAELRAQLAELTKKRGPGRPPKEE